MKPAIKTFEVMLYLLVAIRGEHGWHKRKLGLAAKIGRR